MVDCPRSPEASPEAAAKAGAKPEQSHEERCEVTHPFMSNAWFDAIVRIRDEVGALPVDDATRTS